MSYLGALMKTGPCVHRILGPSRGGSRNSGRGGSKIKFMKGVGAGGGVPPPVTGPGAQPEPLF